MIKEYAPRHHLLLRPRVRRLLFRHRVQPVKVREAVMDRTSSNTFNVLFISTFFASLAYFMIQFA